MKVSLNDSNSQSIAIAGTINEGSLWNQSSYPYGIYVNINFDLYVADSNNHRIQLFHYGYVQSNGITITICGIQEIIKLSRYEILFVRSKNKEKNNIYK